MFKYLKHHEINLTLWDECISRSKQHLIYALSWYLDITAPGWSALIEERQGKYVSVMPVTTKTILGISYVFQPTFAQQLGFFSIVEEEDEKSKAINWLRNKFMMMDYNFNSYNGNILKNSIFAGNIRNRITYLLELNPTYQQLMESYATNNKRNIKKALRNGLSVKNSDDFETLVELFRKMKGLELDFLKNAHYQDLKAIYKAAKNRGCCIMYTTFDKNNTVVAGGFFLVYQKRITYVLGASTAEGKELGAMNLIIDEVIREYSDGEYLLDFEGGEAEGVGRFYKGFGGNPSIYSTLHYNKLSL